MTNSDGDSKSRGLPTRLVSFGASVAPKSWFHPVTAHIHRRAEPEMKEIVDRCDPTGTVLDIGGWYGPWTYWLSKRVQHVHVFEPNPTVAEVLRSGVRSNVTVHQNAVSDESGTTQLWLQTVGTGSEGTASIVAGSNGAKVIEVDAVRIDDFEFSDIRFIKIDVEGHENAVLIGASELIASNHPVVFVELEERMAPIAKTFSLMADHGYEARAFFDGSWQTVTPSELAVMQEDFHSTNSMQSYLQSAVFPSGYVNDVAFVHPQSTWAPW